MLAVHWSPVKNTAQILRNGISVGKQGGKRSGVFCVPLSGFSRVDKWWANVFHNGWRPRENYNGFVFRVEEGDLPAVFADWIWGSDEKDLKTVADIGREYRIQLACRLAFYLPKQFFREKLGVDDPNNPAFAAFEEYDFSARYERAEAILVEASRSDLRTTLNDPEFRKFVFEDFQLVLSRAIAPSRIIRVLSGTTDSGRERVRKFRDRNDWED